jgi:hypothetical protein
MKQRKASSGVQTLGSPRRLKLVLTSTGHPVSSFELRQQPMKHRIGVGIDGLYSRGIVDVSSRAQVAKKIGGGASRPCRALPRPNWHHSNFLTAQASMASDLNVRYLPSLCPLFSGESGVDFGSSTLP